MELRQLMKIGLRWWWLIILPVLGVGLYSGFTYHRPAPTYQVVLRFAAGSDPAGLSVDYDRYYPWLTSEYIANGLADVARTGAFAEAVQARLAEQGLAVTAGAVQDALSSDNTQSIFVIYLTWPDAAQLPMLAEAVSAELTTNGAAYFPQMQGVGILARRLDAPQPVLVAPSLRAQLLGPGLRLLLALVVGLALAFLAHYLDPTVRESAEIEALGVPIVGAIPHRLR